MKNKNKKQKVGLVPSKLKGYRMPTEDEKLRIWTYMKKELKSKNKLWKTGKYITVFFSVILTISIVFKIYEGIINYPELIFGAIITALSWISFFAFRKWSITNKKLAIH